MAYIEKLNALRGYPAVRVEDPIRSSILIRESVEGQLIWSVPGDITEEQLTDEVKAEIDYLFDKWEI